MSDDIPPHIARGLSEEEHRLEQLLIFNYHGFIEAERKECAQRVVKYILGTETVLGKDLDFVKKLTKVADHVTHLGDYLDYLRPYDCSTVQDTVQEFDKRLYTFNLQTAITGKRKLNNDEIEEEHITRVKAHLFAYAGNAAHRLFEWNKEHFRDDKTKWLNWAKRWYGCYHHSAELTVAVEPEHSIIAYSIAAGAAKEVCEGRSNFNEYLKWANEVYLDSIVSGKLAKELGRFEHAEHAYSFAKSAAIEIRYRIRNEITNRIRDITRQERLNGIADRFLKNAGLCSKQVDLCRQKILEKITPQNQKPVQ